MGSASSKFRKHLQSGDEVQALQLYFNNSELRKALDPNCSYGDSYQHETPLHLAAKHGMHKLLRIFLSAKGGNPNKTNAKKETCLHCVCMEANFQSIHVCKRRAECLNELLKWRGAKLAEGHIEKIDLGAKDEKLNTALHYAAASGLEQCVDTLIQHGAPLFVENEENLTPCDTAERNGHARIALLLESKMVFSNDEETLEDIDSVSPVDEYSGLRPQDLQEAKDQLLVETADMLSVPLFTAEALLRNHEWSRETLLEAWMTDAVACCEKCGVNPPVSLFSEQPHVQEDLASPLPSPLHSAPAPLEAECHICAHTFLIADEPVHMSCTHQFCKDCWEKYLNVKIQEGDAHHITCAAYDCTMLVPVDIIERIVSRDMALRYLQFDIKAFVDSNPDMKWCPFAGCGRAVKLPDLELGLIHGDKRNKIPSDTSRGVDCGVGHYFCWECLEESHEPCSCDNWSKWHQKISQIRPETLDGTEQETELAANCLWLVTNSKPCPNCKSPIQKNEGCNHMKCSKCKYDFCWVCLEQWKRHNSSTGGYFKCNRFEVLKKVEEQSAQLVTEAETKNKSMQELSRFVHYYTRFKNHENSYKLEEPLLKTAKDKMMKLAEAVTDSATAQTETKFVEDAVNQLLKARRVLKCSYVYGFYLDGPGYKKIVFEFMQTELEECTEILSQMVNRLYLRTPRRKIIEQANITQRKRLEFIMAISKGLVPPETPPSARRGKKKRKLSGVGPEDEDLHRAIVASIQEVNPANPWIKDASGRHTNVSTLLEWPWPSDESEDSDGEPEKRALRESIGKCRRAGCNKVRAKNPKTNGHHDHCSQYCLLGDRDDQETEEGLTEIVLDEHMELLRALEMSRLQYLRDSGLLHVPDPQDTHKSNLSKSTQTQVHRPRSNSAGQASKGKKLSSSAMTSLEELSLELQRFQDMESAFPIDAADCKKSATQPHQRRKMSQSSRFDETKSTIVTRVPNKSVEDLYLLDQKSSRLGQRLFPEMSRSTSSSVLDQSHVTATFSMEALTPSPTAGERAPSSSSSSSSANKGVFGSMFGAIKDISVSNIHSSESDKTKDFLSKDLASIFVAWDMEERRSQPDLIPSSSGDKLASKESAGTSEKSSKGKSLAKCKKSNQTSYSGDYHLDRQPTASSCQIKDRSWENFSDSEHESISDMIEQHPHHISEHGKTTSFFSKTGHGGIAVESREISLLEMAENLVQMTADVHSRLKEVEKSFHGLDLSSGSKRNYRSEELPPESDVFAFQKDGVEKFGTGQERYSGTEQVGDIGLNSRDSGLEFLPLPKTAWSLGDCDQDAPSKKGKRSSPHKTWVYDCDGTRSKACSKGKTKKSRSAPLALMCDTQGHVHQVSMTKKDKLTSNQKLTVTSSECSYEKCPGVPPQSHSCNDMSALSRINSSDASDLALTVPLTMHPGCSLSRSDDLIEYSLIRNVPRNDTTLAREVSNSRVTPTPQDSFDKWEDASSVLLAERLGVGTSAQSGPRQTAPGPPDDSDGIDYSVYV